LVVTHLLTSTSAFLVYVRESEDTDFKYNILNRLLTR